MLTFLATGALIYPVQSAVASSPVAAARTQIDAPSSVTLGGAADLSGRLVVGGHGMPGRDLTFVDRAPGTTDWQTLGTARTDLDGWANYHVGSVPAPTEFGVYYAGGFGLLGSRPATATVHVVNLVASAPDKVRAGRPARVAGRVLLDGRGVPAQPVHFMFRRSAHDNWHAPRWDRANRSGWASVQRRFHTTYQVGVRFDGTDGLAPSRLVVSTIHVQRPAHQQAAAGFVFPFQRPSVASSPGSWTQDQGVDLAAVGYQCGHAATLVAVGDGVVIQEGISGFGPTAPVIRMTSGPFAGRNVYYGHTGRVFVHVGQSVHAGQRLAEIGCGSVGYSQAPHLEIGVGEPGGPPCCPGWHATSGEMYRELVASLQS